MTKSKNIIIIGHAALDFIYRIDSFPSSPTKLKAKEHIISGGGMAANAAAAAAKLRGNVSLWSRIGQDPAGSLICSELQSCGVNTKYIQKFLGTRSATSAVLVDAHGERFIVSEDDHEMPMGTEWLPLDEIDKAGVVLSDLSWFEGTYLAFKEAKKRGITTIVDMDLGGGRFLEKILNLTDYVICSAPAFEIFVKGINLTDRFHWLLSKGVRHAGVTQGSKGYTWLQKEGQLQHQVAFPIDAIDTTGAGDAFHGAFAWALSEGLEDKKCAEYAAAAASLKCRKLGARSGLPTLEELETFLSKMTSLQ
ncbi:MAG: PfkB family carbohydrate kinase [Hyphomicrobium sp.]